MDCKEELDRRTEAQQPAVGQVRAMLDFTLLRRGFKMGHLEVPKKIHRLRKMQLLITCRRRPSEQNQRQLPP